MTPEQQQHYDEYYAAKRRYENAFIEKRQAENEITEIINRRNQIVNRVNELASERKLNDGSLAELQRSMSQNGDFDNSVRDTELKLESASTAFLAIGESSVGKPQNLTEVFDERNRSSKSAIGRTFEQIKNISSSIQGKIDDITRQINQLESEREDGQNRERYLNGVISDRNSAMNNASIEMAYHQRCLNSMG